ncbi:hypothetical protein GCM10009634_73550 [Saccharothrix xinjiangensis]
MGADRDFRGDLRVVVTGGPPRPVGRARVASMTGVWGQAVPTNVTPVRCRRTVRVSHQAKRVPTFAGVLPRIGQAGTETACSNCSMPQGARW